MKTAFVTGASGNLGHAVAKKFIMEGYHVVGTALPNEQLVLAHVSGKMRKRFIRLTIGDRVRLQMSPYDTGKARIVYRLA